MKLGKLQQIKIEKLKDHLLRSFLIANDQYGIVEDYLVFDIWHTVYPLVLNIVFGVQQDVLE
jgi:hypothetical protein